MKGKLATAGAVLSGLCAFKVCCVLPSLLSLLGLTGSGLALVATRWASLGLLGISVLLMGRSFYTIYVLKCGSRASRWMTWISAAALVLVWTVRLERAAHSSSAAPSARIAAVSRPVGTVAPAVEDDCPCRRKPTGGS